MATATKRPTGVTIVAWYALIVGVLSLTLLPSRAGRDKVQQMGQHGGIPWGIVAACVILRSGAFLAAGAAMLRGRAWGRSLFLIAAFAYLFFFLLTGGYQVIFVLGLVLYVILTYVLFRPSSQAYFCGRVEEGG